MRVRAAECTGTAQPLLSLLHAGMLYCAARMIQGRLGGCQQPPEQVTPAEHTGVLNEDQPDSIPILPPVPFSAPESWGQVLAEDPG